MNLETLQELILVTTDFTSQSDSALEYGVFLTQGSSSKLILLHIVADESDIEEAYSKMAKIVADTKKKYGITIYEMIKEGDVIEDVPIIASHINAKYLIMSHDCVDGIRHLCRRDFLAIVPALKIPFFSISSKFNVANLSNILIPINFNKKTSKLLSENYKLAKIWNAKIFFLVYGKTNVEDCKYYNEITNFLDFNKIDYSVKMRESIINFDVELLDYAREIKADLISIANTLEEEMFNWLGGFDNRIISNMDDTPVMIVHENIFELEKFNND